jgi:hypothetical protein
MMRNSVAVQARSARHGNRTGLIMRDALAAVRLGRRR